MLNNKGLPPPQLNAPPFGAFLRKYSIFKELVFYNIPVLQLQPC